MALYMKTWKWALVTQAVFSAGRPEISSSIKEMAKELNIPIVVLSQLNRASEKRENRRPRLSDLRDSGAIEQDADVVCLLHRPCKHKEDKESTDQLLALVDVAKHRNGETGLVRMNFIDEYTKFEDRVEETKTTNSH